MGYYIHNLNITLGKFILLNPIAVDRVVYNTF
jgi:hypothetical protein